MDKKIKEKEILFKVFKRELVEKDLIASETPDFILTDESNSLRVGVEIATIFDSQASPILRNDVFKDSLIDSHTLGSTKKKPTFLKSVKVAPVEGGKHFIHKGHAIWTIATLENHFGFFENVIKGKNESYSNSMPALEYVSLIALDEDNFFKPSQRSVNVLYNLIREHALFETIIRSNFQEIFYITNFAAGEYAVPLRWLILTSEHAIFLKFWEQLNKNDPIRFRNLRLLIDNFCICLLQMGFNRIYLYENQNFRYLVFGNRVWHINKTNETITESMYFGQKLGDENRAVNIHKNYKNYNNIYQQYLIFRKEMGIEINEEVFPKVLT